MNTEYQAEYCGAGGSNGSMGKGGSSVPIPSCRKSYEAAPVGGRNQQKVREATKLPVYDETFLATAYTDTERGTHRVQPHWRDPRWSEGTRAETATLYETGERDPAHRKNFYVYRSTLIDAHQTPVAPLSVPDIHKLRYMHNNYMTGDDWYN